jgi:hypothetical protein
MCALDNEAVLAAHAFAFLGKAHDVKQLDRTPNSSSAEGSRARG